MSKGKEPPCRDAVRHGQWTGSPGGEGTAPRLFRTPPMYKPAHPCLSAGPKTGNRTHRVSRRSLKTLTLLVPLLLGLALAAGGFLYVQAKRAEPGYSGTVRLDGLGAHVMVRYGAHAVPTIDASDLDDLLFAQGYVVASERMWQMDLMRRLATGRLAEVLGEQVLPADRFFRTIGLGAAARRGLDALDDADRAHLVAYAAGVNAYIAGAEGRLPFEYRIAGFAPALWTPADSLAIAEYMGWVLSFNVREELVFLATAARVGAERAAGLFPVDEGVEPPPVSPALAAHLDAAGVPGASATPDPTPDPVAALIRDLGLPVPGAASNAWLVNRHRTGDGGAILASDPHLAPSMPGIWYQLELVSPELRATGVALPGFPFVVSGHNGHLAWAFTATIADSQDIFIERPTADGSAVERPGGGVEPILVLREPIAVAGRAEPEILEVRTTGHGVIIDDVLGISTGTPMQFVDVPKTGLLALRTNLEIPDRPVSAFRRLNTATTIAQAREAGHDLRRTSVNLMLAHRDGGIAWQVTGMLPERGRGSGKFPSPGWEAGYGWRGYQDPAGLPASVDPADGVIVTANQRTVPAERAAAVSHSWMAPYRAQRIGELLGAADGPLTAADMARIQRDRVSLQVQTFLRALRDVRPALDALDAGDGRAARIADELLQGWDGAFAPDSRPAALFALLQPALYEALYGDELGDGLDALMSIATAHYNALEQVMHTGRSAFWDDIATPQPEGPAEVWANALRAAADALDQRLPAAADQRLDALRQLRFPHAFDLLPLVGPLFSVGPLPVGGDAHTIDVMKTLPSAPGAVTYIPTVRLVMTPTDWAGSRISLPLGQSGHRLSPYRTDRLDDWLHGDGVPLPWGGPAPDETVGVLQLEPVAR
jgi:penicillin G amidase